MWKNDILKTDLVYIWHTCSDEPDKDFDLHCHNEYEILYFWQGDMEFRVGRGCISRLEPMSLLLIPPYTVHGRRVVSEQLCRRVSIHFLPEILDKAEQELFSTLFYLEQNYYPPILSPLNSGISSIDFLVHSILECRVMQRELQSVALRSRIVSLLVQIRHLHSQNTFKSVPANPWILNVLAYLNSHLRQPISLEKVSRKFNVSKNHLNVVFKNETGTTVNHYIRMKRLTLARLELAAGVNTEEAALRAGFKEYSTFFRAYKSFFGYPPSVSTGEEVMQ
ncbi:MAG: AraC family transcriptional regulator [Treponema sp.]|jgi:AraC-like DNA-binding protein|nr:AraC family transcriptional regulator [Treponema sp.]